jgi:fucose permease
MAVLSPRLTTDAPWVHAAGVAGPEERGEVTDAAVDFSKPAFVGATLALGLVGGIVAAYGTILVAIAHHYGLSVPTAGVMLSANFAGAVLGVLGCWWAMGRFPGGVVSTAALAVLGVGLALAASAPSWPVFLSAVVLAGTGFGAVDFAVVALLSRTEPRDRASRLSVSGAGWGFGAVAGPLFIVVARPPRYQLFLAVAAAIAFLLIGATRTVRAPVPRPMAVDLGAPANRGVLPVFVVALGSYVAFETAVAGWLATQLHGWGYAVTVGSGVTAGFWAGLAIGRLGAGRLAARWSPRRLVIGGLSVAIALLFGASVRDLAPFAYPLLGFAIASVFPLGLHWFTELRPGDVNGVGWLIVVDMVGGAVGSGSENVGVALLGLRVVPFVAAGFAVLCLYVFSRALRFPVPVATPP